MSLIDELIKGGYLKTPIIIKAFRNINRADFLPAGMEGQANLNIPLPIGWGQTISQPLTVAFMLELLQPKPGDKILDIGSGSGWATALLACIVSREIRENQSKGRVYAIERIPELMEFGKKNVAKYNFLEKGVVEMRCADGSKGWPNLASYPELTEGFDKIHAAASAQKIPEAWKKQLKIGGRLVTPIRGSIWLLIKKSEKEFEEYEYPGFAFVPLIEE